MGAEKKSPHRVRSLLYTGRHLATLTVNVLVKLGVDFWFHYLKTAGVM